MRRISLAQLFIVMIAAASMWLSPLNQPSKAAAQTATINVTADAVQTFYQDFVPHTDRAGNILTTYQAGSSFFPIGMYYPGPCIIAEWPSWPAFSGDPDFDGDGIADWVNTYQTQVYLGTSVQEGDRLRVSDLETAATNQLLLGLPSDTDLFYRVLPNPYQLYLDNGGTPIQQGALGKPCDTTEVFDPNPIQTLAAAGFNEAITFRFYHPQIFIDLKNSAQIQDFGLVIGSGEDPCSYGFPQNLFDPIALGGQGYSQHPDIYGWQLEDEPLLVAARSSVEQGCTPNPDCNQQLLQDAIDRLTGKYDSHKAATSQVIFHVEAGPNFFPGTCPAGPLWDASVQVGDAANHDHYLKLGGAAVTSFQPIAEWMSRQTNALSEQKPSWFTTQAVSNGFNGFLTPEQHRSSVYTAIVNGATGIWYFMYDSQDARGANVVGVRDSIPVKYPPFNNLEIDPALHPTLQAQGEAQWDEITLVNAELATLEEVLLRPTTKRPYHVFVDQKPDPAFSPIQTMLKSNGSEHHLIAVNMYDATIAAEFDFGVFWDDVDLLNTNVLFEARSIQAGSVLADTFAPFEVHIYELSFGDGDGDGVDDFVDNCPVVSNPPQTDTDMDGLGSVCDPDDLLLDADLDGCSDPEELGPTATLGGQRDPANFWDFFDNAPEPRDRAVAFADYLGVLAHFDTNDNGGAATVNRNTDPLSPEALTPGGVYSPRYDRGGQTGANPWNQAPPNGAISFPDFLTVISQQGHSCQGPP